MKKVVITGANGFVGSSLVNELSLLGIEIYAVVRDETSDISRIHNHDHVHIIYCDLSNILQLPAKITEKNIETFYHLAWNGAMGELRSDYTTQLTNAKYTCDAAKAADLLGCEKFLTAGTVTENIVAQSLQLPKPSQNMVYAICKNTTRQLLNVSSKPLKVQCIWMQFSNIYGPGDVTGNLISYTLFELLKGNRPLFSKGAQYYDFLYITDLINAMILLGESNLSKNFYFLGSGDSRLLSDYLEAVSNALDFDKSTIGIGEREEDGLKYCKEWFGIEDLRSDTGFIPQISYEEGIKLTADWIQGD